MGSFAEAIQILHGRGRVRRKPWIKTRTWLELMEDPADEEMCIMLLKGHDEGHTRKRWNPKHADLLAFDWIEMP